MCSAGDCRVDPSDSLLDVADSRLEDIAHILHHRGGRARGRAARLAARARRAPGATASPPQAGGADDLLVVTGVAHVLAVLEAVEDDRLPGVSAIEPYICDGGCFGSPLLGEDACVASWRWSAVGGDAPGGGGTC